jgi:DNA polymerase-4
MVLGMRWYLHIDMDAFYASVEQALDPSLKGKPVIVGGREGRGVVTSASYEARKYGVRSAMPGFQARQLCPSGIFLPNRHRAYAAFSEKVFTILEQYSPNVRALSIDEGLVELTGTERLLGPPPQTADTIIRRIERELGLPSSGGLSTSRVTAKIAATLAKPRGLICVPPGLEADFLAPLRVGIIPGIGAKTEKALKQKGIETVDDLLRHRELAERYLDIAAAPARQRRHEHSIGSETTLATPVRTRAEISKVLWELVEEVGKRLRQEGLFARCVTVKIRYTDFQTFTRSRSLSLPTCFDNQIFEIASTLVARNVAPQRAIRLLGVSAGALQRSGWQESLLERERRAALERLYRGIDELRLKYGQDTIGAATPRQRRG